MNARSRSLQLLYNWYSFVLVMVVHGTGWGRWSTW